MAASLGKARKEALGFGPKVGVRPIDGLYRQEGRAVVG